MPYTPVSIDAVNRAQMSANIKVAAEPAGVLDSINLSFDSKRAAKGQVITVPVMPPTSSIPFVERDVPGAGTTNLATNVQVLITDQSEQSNSFTGEQLLQLENTGVRDDMLAQFLAQAERTFRNEMDAAAALAIKYGASRAIGTPGTVPFAADLKLLIQAKKVLDNNGAPQMDRQVVTNTSAYANLLATNLVSKANEAGNDEERRRGVIKNQYGFDAIRQSANVVDHTAGAGTGYTTNGTQALKATGIVLTGGTVNTTGIKLGDIVTFATDSVNKYCVNPTVTTTTAYVAPASFTATSGTLTIGNPGLRKSIATGQAMTINSGTTEGGVTGYAPSFAFCRHAVVGVIRPPMIDSSPLVTIHEIKDDVNGITYLFGESVGIGITSWWLWVSYGFKVTQSEYVCLIAG